MSLVSINIGGNLNRRREWCLAESLVDCGAAAATAAGSGLQSCGPVLRTETDVNPGLIGGVLSRFETGCQANSGTGKISEVPIPDLSYEKQSAMRSSRTEVCTFRKLQQRTPLSRKRGEIADLTSYWGRGRQVSTND
jgi:hypothetical protein